MKYFDHKLFYIEFIKLKPYELLLYGLILIFVMLIDYIFAISIFAQMFNYEQYLLPMLISIFSVRFLQLINWDAFYIVYGLIFKNNSKLMNCWKEKE